MESTKAIKVARNGRRRAAEGAVAPRATAPSAANDAPDSTAARRAKRSGLPLYYQVMRDLKEQIVSGKLGPGDRLPSEARLTSRYRVSRVVVRQALQILEDQGLIERERGRGTFVSRRVADDATPRITGSLEDLIHMSPETTIRVASSGLSKPRPTSPKSSASRSTPSCSSSSACASSTRCRLPSSRTTSRSRSAPASR